MKKIIIAILSCILLVGCGDMKVKNAVSDYLNQYKNLSDEVLADLDRVINEEDFNEAEKEKYRDIMKKQYQDMQYEIVDEKYNGDAAVITAKITVYDFYKVEKEANLYMKDNIEEFFDTRDIYSNEKYIDYKLDRMNETIERITYTIDFNVKKKDSKWIVEQPTTMDLEKIHGIYNYES